MSKKAIILGCTALAAVIVAVIAAVILTGPDPGKAEETAASVSSQATATDEDHWSKMRDTYVTKLKQCSNEDATCITGNADILRGISEDTPHDLSDRTYATIQPNLDGSNITYDMYKTGCLSNPTASACIEWAQELNRHSYIVHYTIW